MKNENDDRDAYDPDINDYITTLGSSDITGYHIHYLFSEEELDYDIEEFADQHSEITEFQLIIYRIHADNTTPFLDFLFYYEKNKCSLPYYHHKRKHNIRKETDGIMDKLFTSKYRYKGFFHDVVTDKCFIFYEKYMNAPTTTHPEVEKLISLKKTHNWFWLCTTEIIYQKKYMKIPISDDAVDFFIAYPTVGVLTATIPVTVNHLHSEPIEAPSILYYGSSFCYAKNTALYGLKREPIIARYGPFYYFTTLEHSYYWACYHNTRNEMIRRESDSGGISRYAVFTKRMNTVFMDDEYDKEIVKKYIDRKNMFETKINEYRHNQEVYHPGKFDSIYSYDYSWTLSYDTIYNGVYAHDIKNIMHPVWCVNNHHHFELLSYYKVNTDDIPLHYDLSYSEYNMM